MDDIKRGKFEVVIIVRMLLEGFDYPPFSAGGIVTRIGSPVKFAQFIGKVQQLVRSPEIEDASVKANIVTHQFFMQEDLYEEYIKPVIPEGEDRSLDQPPEE